MGYKYPLNIKDITIPLIIHYYTQSIQDTTQIFPLNHNVRFLPCQHRGVGIMQYVYALNPVCIVLIIPDTPQFPVGAVDIVVRR